MAFEKAILKKVNRFKLNSISKSLDFYLSLGFIYWGLNTQADYYCDLPIPKRGLLSLSEMTYKNTNSFLIGKNNKIISSRTEGNSKNLTLKQKIIYEEDKLKMGIRYREIELK